jgi:hypothetical protein
MVVSGSDLYQIFKNTDPWLNFYSLLPTFKVQPDIDAVDKFKRDPDAIWTDYFFNGGNPLSTRKAKTLAEIPYIDDFLATPSVAAHLAKLVGTEAGKPVSKDAAIKGNLYYIDYSDLEPYEYPVVHNGMYTHAPVILISDNLRATDPTLKLPLGIRFNVPKVLSDGVIDPVTGKITKNGGWVNHQENG